jgi:hypothetical protein
MSGPQVTYTAYGLIAGAALLLQTGAHVVPQRVPSLGAVLAWAMRRRSAQFGIVLAWWWLGWHLVTAR